MRNKNTPIFHNVGMEYEETKHYESLRIQAMWRSVITQALIDAANTSKKKCNKINKIRAIQWLRGDSEDFHTICALADMDADYVKAKVKDAMQRGCKWRKDKNRTGPIDINCEYSKRDDKYRNKYNDIKYDDNKRHNKYNNIKLHNNKYNAKYNTKYSDKYDAKLLRQNSVF